MSTVGQYAADIGLRKMEFRRELAKDLNNGATPEMLPSKSAQMPRTVIAERRVFREIVPRKKIARARPPAFESGDHGALKFESAGRTRADRIFCLEIQIHSVDPY